MRIIDPHLHVDRMKGKDVETLSMAGVEAAILPTPHLLPWLVSAETLLRMWRNFLNFEVNHAKSLGIDIGVTLGVPFYGLDTEAVNECLEQLPQYLENENVVGLGEIGLDAGTEDEVKLFKAQLNIAKEHNLPVIVHTTTPMEPQVVPVVNQIIDVIKGEHFPMDRVVLDHTGRDTLNARLDSGAMVGLSLCYDKLRPSKLLLFTGIHQGICLFLYHPCPPLKNLFPLRVSKMHMLHIKIPSSPFTRRRTALSQTIHSIARLKNLLGLSQVTFSISSLFNPNRLIDRTALGTEKYPSPE